MLANLIRSPNLNKILLIGLGLVTAAVLICLVFFDLPLAQFSNPDVSPKFWQFNRDITEVGKADWYFYLVVLIWIFSFVWLRKKDLSDVRKNFLIHWNQWARAFFLCMLGCGAILHILKIIFGRMRPHRSPDFYQWNFDFFSVHWDWGSFPSGHSQTLFTVATMFALRFPKLTIPLFVLASGFALTRVFTVAHYLSDTIAGGFLGFAATLLILRYFDRKKIIDLDSYTGKSAP